MDEIMKAANAVSNLKLAHEIATDDDFKIVAPKVEQDNRYAVAEQCTRNQIKTLMNWYWQLHNSPRNAFF